MKISVISVSYNCLEDVEITIESLKKQTFRDYEYIVIDGASSDGTYERVKEYEGDFERITVISEPDMGIYDAMNKGIMNSEGEYIYFLNMGDSLYDENVLGKVSRFCTNENDLIYGDICYGDKIVKSPRKINDLFFLREGMICHQAIFAKKSLFDKKKFDTEYRICADRDWMIYQLKQQSKCVHIDECIAVYNLDGISSNVAKYQKDSIQVTKKYYGILGCMFVHVKRKVGKLKKLFRSKR